MSTAVITPVNPMAAEGKDTVLAVMRRDRENFTRLVSDPKNWNVNTRCTGWETRDLVGHMIDVMEGYFKNWDAAVAGKEGTALGLPVMGETLNDHALEFRKLPREEALDRFKKDAQKLDKMLADLTPEQWTSFMVYHPFAGPVPAGFYGTFQIMDYGVHPYDIEYGLGNKLGHVDGHAAQAQCAAVDLAQLEQVVDQAAQMLGVAQEQPQVALYVGALGNYAVGECLDHRPGGGQRGTQVVRHC